ncbi:MAG: hypothetical protein CL997_05740 [Euryarchaeota archaeon]|jgi:hypothetical protein|nr:hypothetical protein [Euryarchaeota archaeon]|tara:strand:+ start:91 stop:453 length:363 start_codon:yes stop_codon:yes gene_type:complete
MFQSLDQGINQDRYFEIQEQMGQPVEESKIPYDIQDFPDVVILAVNVFNRLGDRVYPEIGYVGKDYTNLDLYMQVEGVEKHQKNFFLEVLEWLDARAIKKSAEQLKREYDKMKRKPSGRK